MQGWSGSATLSSGDTVYFRSQDTWTSATVPVFAATAGVTYDGKTYGSGTRAKITTTKSEAPIGIERIVNIDADNVIFMGFEVDCNQKYITGIAIGDYTDKNTAYVTIDDCVVWNNFGTELANWMYGLLVAQFYDNRTVSNVTIINSEFYNCWGEGIAVYASWTKQSTKNNYVTIKNCKIHNNGTNPYSSIAGTGISINNDSDNTIVEYCDIYSNTGQGIDIRVSPASEEPGHVVSAPNGTIIRYNTIRSNGQHGFHATNPRDLAQDGVIYGNLFYGNGTVITAGASELMISTSDDYAWTGCSYNIYNNTFYSTYSGEDYRCNVCFGWDSGSLSGLTVNFKNNIIYTTVTNTWPVSDHTDSPYPTINHSNNLYFNAGAATATHYRAQAANYDRNGGAADLLNWEDTAQKGDPLLTNYRLTVNSPAKDNGADLGAPYNMGLHPNSVWPSAVGTIPQGAAWDIGAFIYSAGASAIMGAGTGSIVRGAGSGSLTITP
jgi:hypothetical protein